MTNAEFKSRLTDRVPLLGAFLKTPHPIIVEVMARAGFDFLVVDAEHAPFDRGSVDAMILAGRACACPILVRVPVATPDWMLNVLDAGAAGVMVPHVETAEQARSLVKAMAYGPGGRGFSASSRSAGYGTRKLAEHLTGARDEAVLICQIEDPEGVVHHDEIAAVEGVDALFVGRADLAVSHGFQDFFDSRVAAMTQQVLSATGATTGLFCTPGEALQAHRKAGASFFVVGSEHSLMLEGGKSLTARFRM